MRTVIGLGVASDTVRVLAVRGGRVRWFGETEIAGAESLSDAVGGLLDAAPIPRWLRPSVVAAIGPALTQTKRIQNLPPLTDERALAGIIRESASRFFLNGGPPLLTTRVLFREPDQVWAAAFELPVVRALEVACQARRLRLHAVVPTVAVLGRVMQAARIVWRDGAVWTDIRLADGGLDQVVRHREAVVPAPPHDVATPPALAHLGDDGWRFADALGAAMLEAGEPMVLYPGREPGRGPAVPPWRLAAAGAALVIGSITAMVSPGLLAVRAEQDAVARLARSQVTRAAAAEIDGELRLVDEALEQVAGFDMRRRSMLLLLGDLNRSLPDGSALTALQVDTVTGTLTALSPRAGTVLDPLERVPGLASPEIVGPVSRDLIGGRELERVTIRFRLEADSRGPTPDGGPYRP